MTPTIAIVTFYGGPLDGARLTVRVYLSGLPIRLPWYCVGRRWMYALNGNVYKLDSPGERLKEKRIRLCLTCEAPMVSPNAEVWWCSVDAKHPQVPVSET